MEKSRLPLKLSKRPESSSFRQRIASFLYFCFLELCRKSLSTGWPPLLLPLDSLSRVSLFSPFLFNPSVARRRQLNLGERGFYFQIEELCNLLNYNSFQTLCNLPIKSKRLSRSVLLASMNFCLTRIKILKNNLTTYFYKFV